MSKRGSSEVADSYDFLVKLLIIGDAGTGKSCLLQRFLENKFKENTAHTIGVAFGSKVIQLGTHTLKIQIWDTAGQERFRSVTKSYYRGAAGALIVFDLHNRKSFESVQTWLSDARRLASSKLCIILCGNKSDLTETRKIDREEASQFAAENRLIYCETSALTGDGVEHVFSECAQRILTQIESGEIDPESNDSGVQYGTSLMRPLLQIPLAMPEQKKSCCG